MEARVIPPWRMEAGEFGHRGERGLDVAAGDLIPLRCGRHVFEHQHEITGRFGPAPVVAVGNPDVDGRCDPLVELHLALVVAQRDAGRAAHLIQRWQLDHHRRRGSCVAGLDPDPQVQADEPVADALASQTRHIGIEYGRHPWERQPVRCEFVDPHRSDRSPPGDTVRGRCIGSCCRPAWLLFHAVVLAGVVLMTLAGFWQLDRLDERKDFNAQVRERSQRAPFDLSSVLDELDAGTLDPETAEWLPVTASGTYLPDQVLEFNNSQDGRAGDNVLTALVLDPTTQGDESTQGSGTTTVIVNRGFIPLGIDVPPPPAVEVTIVGFIRSSEARV